MLSTEAQRERIRRKCPWTVAWMDSIYRHHCVKDTFLVMPSGYKALFVAKGSIHAMAYRDHHQEYTREVGKFVGKNMQ